METDDFVEEEEELAALVQLYAARRAQAIMKREGAALVSAVRETDQAGAEAGAQLLAAAIARAIADAYCGVIDGDEADEPAAQSNSP